MNFKDFVDKMSTLKNYEIANGKINLIIMNSSEKILYNKNGSELKFEFKSKIQISKDKNHYHVDMDEDGTYYICFPMVRKERDFYKNNGYVFITDINSKQAMSNFLIVCELIAAVVGNSVVVEELPSIYLNASANRDHEIGNFTNRELVILNLIADGGSDRQIESSLKISRPTLRADIKSLFNKTNTSSRSELIKYYFTKKYSHVKESAVFFSFNSS